VASHHPIRPETFDRKMRLTNLLELEAACGRFEGAMRVQNLQHCIKLPKLLVPEFNKSHRIRNCVMTKYLLVKHLI
jgi:hypothetical protein